MATTAGSRNQTNGVLSVTTTQIPGNSSKQNVIKPASSKMKLVVRRLAPGLTEAEFFSILGDDWKAGQGKVDWFQYKPGKDSKDPSKPSRPSRAYLHLANSDNLLPFSEAVRKSSFEDAKNTYTNSCLIGPPSVEFAPYSRVPAGLKRRTDARAGTIDQDSEFMAFLEGLANPITTKEAGADGEDIPTGKAEKVTVTPLVQFLKDKKANKTKELAAKAAKKQETSKFKGKEGSSSTDDGRKSNKDSKPDKVAATQEAVRILNREAAKKTVATSSSSLTSAAASTSTENNVPKLDTSKIPASERQAVVAAHVRMLRRHLGLNPSQAHRRIKRDTASAVKAEASEKPTTTPNNTSSSQSTPTTPTGPKITPVQPSAQSGSRRARRGNQNNVIEPSANKAPTIAATVPAPPMVLLRKPDTQQRAQQRPSTANSQSSFAPQVAPKVAPKVTPAAPTTTSPQQATPNRGSKAQVDVPSKGARQAFIKHANPSQGVTEPLLKEALEKFGKVSMVEIDKKKGFAYADFEDPEGLKKAMAANPVAVAQGTVHVMQRKGNQLPRAGPAPRAPPLPPANPALRGGRGGVIGRRGGRNVGGRGRVDAPATDSSKPAPATPTGPAPK
ncbi:hypothetical protein SBOR_6791 [Sclerotinia borealis F-4128]|uniref:RRM domain-containing protein n=1 Tax=Sclerotinia borealis (strain F-4128) TaxID=1432307 RepID=W9C7X8_SCLBF|nr:hypothetical protein SBOR_6791 [Sclerotinia borealis F-4128]